MIYNVGDKEIHTFSFIGTIGGAAMMTRIRYNYIPYEGYFPKFVK